MPWYYHCLYLSRKVLKFCPDLCLHVSVDHLSALDRKELYSHCVYGSLRGLATYPQRRRLIPGSPEQSDLVRCSRRVSAGLFKYYITTHWFDWAPNIMTVTS